MFFGVAYYPEHWPEEGWSVDAEMTQYAGLNAVRMGDFGWSKFEPAEGTYGFDPNYAEDAREVSLQGEGGLSAGQVVDSIRLGPADVCILKRAWPER